MRRIIGLCSVALVMASCSQPDIKMTFEGFDNDTIYVMHAAIEDVPTFTRDSDPLVTHDTLIMEKGVAQMAIDGDRARQYICMNDELDYPLRFFAQPGEKLQVKVVKKPYGYDSSVKGSKLMENVSKVRSEANEYTKALVECYAENIDSQARIDSLRMMQNEVVCNYVRNNLDDPASVWLLNMVYPDSMLVYIDRLGEHARNSILAPLYADLKKRADRQALIQRAQEAIAVGKVAPDFALPSLGGDTISLASLRGRWVVLDFWGSWCRYCIQGFDKMKEYYNKHRNKCAFVGICCHDTEEDWRAAVDEYSLPWINLFNARKENAAEQVEVMYAIQGYPTKIVIDPQGVIAKVVLGEEPDFYPALDELLK